MNDKLKNYAAKPDPEVWERIEKTMRGRAVRRQMWTGVAGAALVALAIVGVVLWPEGKSNVTVQPVAQDVAQVMPRGDNPVAAAQRDAEVANGSHVMVETRSNAEERRVDIQPASVVSVPPSEAPAVAVRPTVAKPVAVAPSVDASTAPNTQVPALVLNEPQTQDVPVVETTEAVEPAKPMAKASANNNEEDTVLWLPNIFVPGSDDAEINQFRARLNHPGDVLTNYRMTIFSRAGNQVFVSNDINVGWNGTYKGREMPQAAYVYVIYYTDKDGFHHQRKGTVTLVR